MTNLYTISEEIFDITKQMEFAETPEEEEKIMEQFNALNMSFNDKVSNICKVLRDLETDQEKIKNEVTRLNELMTKKYNASARLKEYVASILKLQWVEKLELDLFKLSFRKSEAVFIQDETLIPDCFRSVKQVESIDKIAIKEALKDDRTVPWTYLETRQNLQIK